MAVAHCVEYVIHLLYLSETDLAPQCFIEVPGIQIHVVRWSLPG